MNPVYAVVNYPVSEDILELKRKNIIVYVYCGMTAVVGRHGTNLKTLRKILKTATDAEKRRDNTV